MKIFIRLIVSSGLLAVIAGTSTLFGGITAGELAERMEAGESIALIDVRSNADFVENHIPGAMNISERVINPRRLPANRPVVFYDDGLGRANAEAVVQKVKAEGRSDVQHLKGGLAAWESAGLTTTAPKGFRKEQMPGITYQTLSAVQGRDVTLLDIREPAQQRQPTPAGPIALSTTGKGRELTDLTKVFPEARVVRAELRRGSLEVPAGLAASGAPGPRSNLRQAESGLIVVVDNGDGEGEEVVRRLHAQGNKRVVLLIGGERILERQGRSGLERRGLGAQTIDAQELNQEDAR